jgi:membrane protease YdiL (CAAX protease family)
LPPALSLIIVWLSVRLGQASFDPSMTMAQVAGYEFASGADFRGSFLLQLLPAAIILPALWAPIAVGEEIGWRGFLLPRLMNAGLGQWTALALTGAIWGFWHAPLVLSGCMSPGHPLVGMIYAVIFSTLLGIVYGWLWLASGSVWVSAVAHAAGDTISRRVEFLLTPGFNGYMVSLLGWIVYAVFIAWLAWTGRLPVRPEEREAVGPVSHPEYAK